MNGVSFRKEDYSKAKISFNLSKQHEDNALSLRKKNLNEFFAQKRKLKSDISNNLIQRTPNEKGYAELFSIITEKNTKRIFEYINEINNDVSFDIKKLKYGLDLLNEKLNRDIIQDNFNEINEILGNGLINAVNKIFQYSKNEIETQDKNDEFLRIIYSILVNYSFYAAGNQLSFLLTEESMQYHLFFLKQSSNDEIIADIFQLISNVIFDSSENAIYIFSYRNNEFNNLVDDITCSAITTKINKDKILISANSLFSTFIDCIYKEFKQNQLNHTINFDIIKTALTCLSGLLNYKNCIDNGIWAVRNWFKLLFKCKMYQFLFNFLLEFKIIFPSLTSVDYNSSNEKAELLIPFSNIMSIPFELANDDILAMNNDQIDAKVLNSLLEDIIEELAIFEFINSRLKEKNTAKVKCSLIKLATKIISLPPYDKYFCESNLLLTTVNMMSDSNYSVRKEILKLMITLSGNGTFTTGSVLVSKGILVKLVGIIDPNNTICPDSEQLLLSLQVIMNILHKGEFIAKLNNKNSFLDKFELLGGKNAIEKLLGHANKDVYQKAEEIDNKFFINYYTEVDY